MCPRCVSAPSASSGRPHPAAVSLSGGLKTCTACDQAKPTSEYLSSRFYADGHSDRCRTGLFEASAAERRDRKQRTKARAEREAKQTKPTPATKICRRCGETKPEDQFSKGKGGRRTSLCKRCDATRKTAARDKNPEADRARKRQLRVKHRERRRAADRTWRAEYPNGERRISRLRQV
jgi:hypothetical protein